MEYWRNNIFLSSPGFLFSSKNRIIDTEFMNIQLFLTGWLICIIALCFIKLKWAVALFLAYIMLVPYINLGIPGLGTGDNVIRLIMLMCSLKELLKKHRSFNFKPLVPFIVYFLVSLLMIPFQSGEPTSTMLTNWRKDLMNILLLPLVIWNVFIIDKSSLKLFKNTMLICIIVSVGYGLFLTQLEGVNPYVMYFSQFREDLYVFESYYQASGQGRLFGRISSVYFHPMAFALFLGFSIIYLFYVRKSLKWYVFIIILFLTILMSLLCGVRSVLGGLFVAFIYYLFTQKSFKLLILSCVCGLFFLVFISFLPELSTYLGSMIHISNDGGEFRGSSVEMRVEQLIGAIEEASKNPLFGLGYKWTDYYVNLKGDHPICLAFESLAFVVICNSGIIGVLLWVYMILWYFRINKNMNLWNLSVINSMMVFYISYSIITGEYGYMKTFLIFYILLLGEARWHNHSGLYNHV